MEVGSVTRTVRVMAAMAMMVVVMVMGWWWWRWVDGGSDGLMWW